MSALSAKKERWRMPTDGQALLSVSASYSLALYAAARIAQWERRNSAAVAIFILISSDMAVEKLILLFKYVNQIKM
jgi:hypothetical protein